MLVEKYKPESLEEMKEIYIITALNLWLYDHGVDINGTGVDHNQRYEDLGIVPKCITVDEYKMVASMLILLDKHIGISSHILERNNIGID